MSERVDEVMRSCCTDGRICPWPEHWDKMYRMLPGRNKRNSEVRSLVPLILGAWHCTGALDKQLRLRDQLEWAEEHGVLDKVEAFLKGLGDDDWFTF